MIEELLHPHAEILLIVTIREAVRLTRIRQQDHLLAERGVRLNGVEARASAAAAMDATAGGEPARSRGVAGVQVERAGCRVRVTACTDDTDTQQRTRVGAITRTPGRVTPDATAFPSRDAYANLLTASQYPIGTDAAPHMAPIRQYRSKLERFTQGFYINDLDPEHTAASINSTFRTNHARLVAVKNKYDPKNLFRMNANIKPTV